ncbi:DNA helicase UvrD [[Pasteurella] aerogenes]|nr:DNA helicase UvrD [[Pasteurella] aerogenes]
MGDKLKKWFYHVLIAVDQLFNALTGGGADETLSSRTYRHAILSDRPKQRWNTMYLFIEFLFFWEKEHCKTAYESELKGKQYPSEFKFKRCVRCGKNNY